LWPLCAKNPVVADLELDAIDELADHTILLDFADEQSVVQTRFATTAGWCKVSTRTPVPGSSVAMPSGYGPSRGRTTPGWGSDGGE
jgi:hypothetical protein